MIMMTMMSEKGNFLEFLKVEEALSLPMMLCHIYVRKIIKFLAKLFLEMGPKKLDRTQDLHIVTLGQFCTLVMSLWSFYFQHFNLNNV